MTRKSDETRKTNERALERRMVLDALRVQPKRQVPAPTGMQVFWRSEITPSDIRIGREYERAAIAAAEREAARRRA